MSNKLRVFEAFSGYGSQSIALRNIGVEHEVVAISEIDKYAIKAYEAIHGEVNNLGDISKIKVEDIPEHDLFTYSFPCQSISVSGKQEGIVRGKTRSGLLYECERIIEHCKPKYLLMENVKNLVGKKFKPQFEEWLKYLEDLGYTNYWKVLNAKEYGVPQHRERVFVVSILGEHKPYEFPSALPLEKKLKDVLENNYDKKYDLKDVKKFFIKNSFDMEHKGNGFRFKPHVKRNAEVSNTITTRAGGRMDDNYIIDLDINETKFEYSVKYMKEFLLKNENNADYEHSVYDINDFIKTLSTIDNEQTKQVLEAIQGNMPIRKLTTRECFRLMGLNDKDIDKIQNANISNTQQYKMAGNSIVVNVLEGIFKEMFLK